MEKVIIDLNNKFLYIIEFYILYNASIIESLFQILEFSENRQQLFFLADFGNVDPRLFHEHFAGKFN